MDDETRNKVKEIKEKISDLQVEYSKNCTEESTKLIFSPAELGKCLFISKIKTIRYNKAMMILNKSYFRWGQ